jgi:hypothetical protein
MLLSRDLKGKLVLTGLFVTEGLIDG